jgi:putative methyltransferase (TIGR04325 family)
MNLKEKIKRVTPPVLIDLARCLQSELHSRAEWEYIPEGWNCAMSHPEVKGWNVQDVLEAYKQKWPQFVAMINGTGPLGLAHESTLTTDEDIISHNIMMTFAYTLTLASRMKERISILDWGGGIGHYYLLAQKLLPDVEIDYHCKDVPVLCRHGAQLFPKQHFYEDESCFGYTYDFVMASTSMHYTEDWKSLLLKLAQATSGYLYIANLPIVLQSSSFVFVQRPYRYGYNTEYLAWCLNRNELLSTAERGNLTLIREFIGGHRPYIKQAPEQNLYRGFLFTVNPERGHETRIK